MDTMGAVPGSEGSLELLFPGSPEWKLLGTKVLVTFQSMSFQPWTLVVCWNIIVYVINLLYTRIIRFGTHNGNLCQCGTYSISMSHLPLMSHWWPSLATSKIRVAKIQVGNLRVSMQVIINNICFIKMLSNVA